MDEEEVERRVLHMRRTAGIPDGVEDPNFDEGCRRAIALAEARRQALPDREEPPRTFVLKL